MHFHKKIYNFKKLGWICHERPIFSVPIPEIEIEISKNRNWNLKLTELRFSGHGPKLPQKKFRNQAHTKTVKKFRWSQIEPAQVVPKPVQAGFDY